MKALVAIVCSIISLVLGGLMFMIYLLAGGLDNMSAVFGKWLLLYFITAVWACVGAYSGKRLREEGKREEGNAAAAIAGIGWLLANAWLIDVFLHTL